MIARTEATPWPTTMVGVAERVRGLERTLPLQETGADLREHARVNDGHANPDRRRRPLHNPVLDL